MIYRDFGRTGWKVSAVGLGTWNIGNQWGELDDATAFATVRKALDCGMNLVDTADAYGIPHGFSEMRLGASLAGVRHQVYLVGKVGHWGGRTGQTVPYTTPDMIRLCCHASLGRLRTDWLDVLLCHDGNIRDPSVFLQGFDALRKEGHIRCHGISTNDLDVLKRFNADGQCAVVEVDYSLVNRAPEKDFLPYCAENGIGVLVRGPLARGLLSGKYGKDAVFGDQVRQAWNPGKPERAAFDQKIAEVEKLRGRLAAGESMVTAALRYVISHPAAPVAIPGAKSPDQAAQNASAGDRPMTADEFRKWQD